MTPSDYTAFATRFIGAIQAGDVDAVRDCYAPDARIWHNTDGVEQTVDDNIRVLRWMLRVLPDRHYLVQRIEPLADGYLQQHVLEATMPDGSFFAMEACIVVRMRAGKIVRLDEYLDSAKTQALQGLARPR